MKKSLVHVLVRRYAPTRGGSDGAAGKGRNGVSVLSAVKAIVATGLAAFTIRDAP